MIIVKNVFWEKILTLNNLILQKNVLERWRALVFTAFINITQKRMLSLFSRNSGSKLRYQGRIGTLEGQTNLNESIQNFYICNFDICMSHWNWVAVLSFLSLVSYHRIKIAKVTKTNFKGTMFCATALMNLAEVSKYRNCILVIQNWENQALYSDWPITRQFFKFFNRIWKLIWICSEINF